jgi:hypothetical protein
MLANCHKDYGSGDDDSLGARSGPVRNRSGVLKAKVIVVPPWESPARSGS